MKDTKTSILFVLNRFPGIGGIENVTIFLANFFVRNLGYRCSVFSLFGQVGIDVDSQLDNRIHLYRADITNFSCAAIISEIQRKEDVSCVIYQDSYSPTLYLLDYFDRKKVKILVVEHNTPDALIRDKVAEFITEPINSLGILIRKILFPYLYIKNRILVYAHHRLAYAKADKYIVLSSSYISLVKKMVGSCVKLTYINNPVTLHDKSYDLDSLYDKHNEILFVCRLTTQKGTDMILKIWRLFSLSHKKWILRIVGDGPERGSMEKYVKKYGLENVLFEGFKTDVIPYYKRAKVVCMTSRFEGWGLVLVEGMTYACVPIAFDSYGALRDIIDDGINGHIVKPYNIKEFVQKLSGIVDDRRLIGIMQKNAFDKAKSFSIDIIGKKWNTVIQS